MSTNQNLDKEGKMAGIQLDTIVQVVTILGGLIALLLALLQIVETYLDVGEKLRKQRLRKKQKRTH
jgi:hypothetical protein